MDRSESPANPPARPEGTYPPSTAIGLVTDLYELRMAASYLKRGMTGPATFSLFVRRLPPDRRFLVAAGLDDALRAVERFRFDDDQLAWLAGHGFDQEARAALASVAFDGDIWAVPEGTIVFPEEPLLEVRAPLPVAQLVETVLLNQITYQTAVASKAARCRLAARGRARLVDFAFRRTHGVEAGLAVARASAIAGFQGTSNTEAARRFDLDAVGTMAHSYIEAFPDERTAFDAFLEDFPDHATLLVDTYDSRRGIDRAVAAATAVQAAGGRTVRLGLRLDSGDLGALAVEARERLDAAGHDEATIVASGGLNEGEIARLIANEAPIDVFGVGTSMGVSDDAPSLDSVYKLVEHDGRPVMKLSPGKETRPGPKQVHRFDEQGYDRLACRSEQPPGGSRALLEPIMVAGRRVGPADASPSAVLVAARTRFETQLAALPATLQSLEPGPVYRVEVSDALAALTRSTRRQVDRDSSSGWA